MLQKATSQLSLLQKEQKEQKKEEQEQKEQNHEPEQQDQEEDQLDVGVSASMNASFDEIELILPPKADINIDVDTNADKDIGGNGSDGCDNNGNGGGDDSDTNDKEVKTETDVIAVPKTKSFMSFTKSIAKIKLRKKKFTSDAGSNKSTVSLLDMDNDDDDDDGDDDDDELVVCSTPIKAVNKDRNANDVPDTPATDSEYENENENDNDDDDVLCSPAQTFTSADAVVGAAARTGSGKGARFKPNNTMKKRSSPSSPSSPSPSSPSSSSTQFFKLAEARHEKVGKHVKNTKVRSSWLFQYNKKNNKNTSSHHVSLTWSKCSSRVLIHMDDKLIHSTKVTRDEAENPYFVYKWTTNTGLQLQIVAAQKVGSMLSLKSQALIVDGERFENLPDRRD